MLWKESHAYQIDRPVKESVNSECNPEVTMKSSSTGQVEGLIVKSDMVIKIRLVSLSEGKSSHLCVTLCRRRPLNMTLGQESSNQL